MRSAARLFVTCAILPLCAILPAEAVAQQPDLIIVGGRVWTGEPDRPWAEAVAVRGDRIAAVGSHAEILALRGDATRVVDAADRFIAPGFIDNHTHFGSAGALLLGVNLLDVADAAGLIRRVREARDRLPAGAWLIGGDWGAYEAWQAGTTGREAAARRQPPFQPHRVLIDSLTPDHPALLNRWDRSVYLANARALEIAGVTCEWAGVDCERGAPTGRLGPAAAARVRAVIPPKPFEQRLLEARTALAHLAELGVTTIHDNTPAEQLAVFQALRARDELTVRVYARPTLDRVEHLAALGIRHGFGDDWLRIGGLKGFVDGIMGNSSARFYEPYLTTGERGSWRPMMEPPGNMERLLAAADAAGHWPQVHAIGDEAVDTLLTMFERVWAENGPRERRWRVIHTQVLRDASVAERMARLGVIAEVQPFHAIDDMRWMEERIGERARWAYAFRTLDEAGVVLSFGSDWPGTNASWYPADPLQGIYAAVTRQTLDGVPEGGWFPEERVAVETALRAYTVNNAWAAGEEAIKGSLARGKLADIVVLDRDPFRVEPDELKDVKVLMTVVGGRIVHDVRPTS
jgi:predicted amidohydrolase YtcJ